ncbi:MAG: helix-turn-helix domain-containing protein [Myxococcota bacterium]
MSSETDGAPRYSLYAGTSVACRLLEVDPLEMLRRAGLSLDQERHEREGVTAQEFYRAWNALVELACADDVAFTLGTALARGPFVPAMFALSCAPNLEVGLQRLAPYKALLGPTAWVVAVDPQSFRVSFMPAEPGLTQPHSLARMQAVLVLDAVRTFAGRRVVPQRVELAAPALLEAFFGIPPVAGGHASLTFGLEDARRPFISENARLWESFERDLLPPKQEGSLKERAQLGLRRLLFEGHASVDLLAQVLGVSGRTLQRDLHGAGLSYTGLLEETRRALARHYLKESRLSNDEIAYLLGYANPTSFYRAFREWTGMTPSEARTNLDEL